MSHLPENPWVAFLPWTKTKQYFHFQVEAYVKKFEILMHIKQNYNAKTTLPLMEML